MRRPRFTFPPGIRFLGGCLLVLMIVMPTAFAASGSGASAAPDLRGDGYAVLWQEHSPAVTVDGKGVTIYFGPPVSTSDSSSLEEIEKITTITTAAIPVISSATRSAMVACGFTDSSRYGWLAADPVGRAACFGEAEEKGYRDAFAFFLGLIEAAQSDYLSERMIPVDRYRVLATLYEHLAMIHDEQSAGRMAGIISMVGSSMAQLPYVLDPETVSGIRFEEDRQNEMLSIWNASVDEMVKRVKLTVLRGQDYAYCRVEVERRFRERSEKNAPR